MNKKFITLVLPIILGVVLVAAIGYYAVFSATFNVVPAITLSGECEDTLGDVYSGDVVEGSECIITNDAPTERDLVLTNDATEGIEVSYIGELQLSMKDTTTWEAFGDSITVGYTVIGDSFEVTGVPEGYTAIYYKDEVVGLEGRVVNPQPAISIVGIGDLPEIDDANVDALTDYTQSPDFYNQMKGAKLWIVSTSDLTGEELNWANMGTYYYEMDLIQYNSDGEIVLYSGASLTITPVYDIGVGVTGEQTVTTTVDKN